MLQILLFLTAQLFALSLSSTISPMTPAPELLTTTAPTTPEPITTTSNTATTTNQTTTVIETQVATQTSTPTAITPTAPEPSTQQAEALHNNVFVFLNECIDDPQDNLLRDAFLSITAARANIHLLTPLTAAEKAIIKLQEYFQTVSEELVLPEDAKNVFLSTYLINNSSYCIVLPHQKNSPPDNYDQNNLLDLSGCTPLCHKELFEENSATEILNRLRITIQEAQKKLSLQKKETLKKESAVLRQLFSKQIKAHDLFASDPQVDESGYTLELYKLATQRWHFYFNGHGATGHSIAGFDFETGEIWKTLKVLNHLSTGYLIIYSCHAGGVNREILTGRYRFSAEDFPAAKNLEALINSLSLSYKIIICSPTDSTSKTAPLLVTSTVQKLTKKNFDGDELEDKRLLKIFGESGILLGKNLQINQLPLVNRPYQSTFKPFLPSSKKEYSPAVIDNAYTITSTNQCKHHAEKTTFSINEKSVIETDQSIIKGLKIKPQINLSAITEQEKSLLENIDCYGHEKNIQRLFPVTSDIQRNKYTSSTGNQFEMSPEYPSFISLQVGTSSHYIGALLPQQTDTALSGEKGVFLCLRDLFFNANMRASTHLYFIKSIMGTNDIPQHIIDKKVFGGNFPAEGSGLILSNVALLTFCHGHTHYLLGAFSCRGSYYTFSLMVEYEKNPQDWGCIQKLDSREHFEQKLCLMEDLACSKIYNRLKSYPESHPQHQLIKQYLDRKKSIFLDFENSYPLFKEDHLPEDDRAWEQLPELLKRLALKQQELKRISEMQDSDIQQKEVTQTLSS